MSATNKHRITGPNCTNPCTYESPLDVTRCAALHNGLIETRSEDSDTISDVVPVTWWERFGSQAESPENKLHPAVIEVLQTAWHCWGEQSKIYSQGEAPDLFWGIKGLTTPADLFENGVAEDYAGMNTLDVSEFDDYSESDVNTDDDTPPQNSPPPRVSDTDTDTQGAVLGPDPPLYLSRFRFITLYQSSIAQHGEPLGIVFDQRQHLAIFVAAGSKLPDSLSFFRSWLPLEVILDLWHSTVDYGKVSAIDGRWLMRPFCPNDLTDTLRAWHELIREIESRIPENAAASSSHDEYLLDQWTAHSLGMSGFR